MVKRFALVAAATAVLGCGASLAFAAPAVAETDTVGCLGTAGYGGTSTWSFQEIYPPGILGLAGGSCKIHSPDNKVNFPISTGGEPIIGSIADVLNCRGTSGLGLALCLAHAVSPGGTNLALGTVFGTLSLINNPRIAGNANVSLTGTGTLKCGNGTLSGTGYDGNGPEADFSLVWSAKFTNGVGTVTGTATSDGFPTDDPSDAGGTVKALTGKIFLGDGFSVAGHSVLCNDTKAPIAMLLKYTG